MAKQGVKGNTAKALLRDICENEGWTLCIGAGTSHGMFPDWNELVRKLVQRDTKDPTKANKLCQSLLSSYSPDALIQAAFERLSFTPQDLAEILYEDVRAQLGSVTEWKKFARILGESSPGTYSDETWTFFVETIRTKYPSLPALRIADVITDLLKSNLAPRAIISFNAEPVFYSLLNALSRSKYKDKRRAFNVLIRSTSNRNADRIPYIFCHGLLPVPELSTHQNKQVSCDKLVFSETEYLQLANNSYSWQSTQFINYASSTRILFIGVSLSDSNMRRWLSWVHANRIQEITHLKSTTNPSTRHYWIHKSPGTDTEEKWIEATVAHLGVRVIWIDDWPDAAGVIKRLVGKS